MWAFIIFLVYKNKKKQNTMKPCRRSCDSDVTHLQYASQKK